MAEKRRFYGGMKPVKDSGYTPSPQLPPPPPMPEKKQDTRPPQKGTGEESVE
jgi:hypothetical protein